MKIKKGDKIINLTEGDIKKMVSLLKEQSPKTDPFPEDALTDFSEGSESNPVELRPGDYERVKKLIKEYQGGEIVITLNPSFADERFISVHPVNGGTVLIRYNDLPQILPTVAGGATPWK